MKFPKLKSFKKLSKFINSINNQKLYEDTDDTEYNEYVKLFKDAKNNSSGEVSVNNALSWDPETHPDGIGDSLWVKSIDWIDNKLHVEFRDGFKCYYPDVSYEEAVAFSKAPSKGRWAYYNLKQANRKYVEE